VTYLLRFLTILFFIFLLAGALIPSNDLLAQATAGQPIMLFDGQTTNGWGKADGQAHDGWVVQDGALFRQAGGGDLYHEGTYRDFVLHFQWKISPAGNSGLKYRVRKYGNALLGCEYQILDDQGNTKEPNKSAALYDVYDPAPYKPIVASDVWQTSKIVVCGNRIEHWLNGIQVVQADVGSPDWKASVADSKFRDREGFGANREGRIFLQDHGNPVWFRQIVLVPLSCDSNNAFQQPWGLPGPGISDSPGARNVPLQYPGGSRGGFGNSIPPRIGHGELRGSGFTPPSCGCDVLPNLPSIRPANINGCWPGIDQRQRFQPRWLPNRRPALFLRRR